MCGVDGDDFAPLGYIVNVKWFFAKLQEFWRVSHESRPGATQTTLVVSKPERVFLAVR